MSFNSPRDHLVPRAISDSMNMSRVSLILQAPPLYISDFSAERNRQTHHSVVSLRWNQSLKRSDMLSTLEISTVRFAQLSLFRAALFTMQNW